MRFIFINLENLFLSLKSNLTSCFGRNKTNSEWHADPPPPPLSLQKWPKKMFVPKDAQCSETYIKKSDFFLHIYVTDDSKNIRKSKKNKISEKLSKYFFIGIVFFSCFGIFWIVSKKKFIKIREKLYFSSLLFVETSVPET